MKTLSAAVIAALATASATAAVPRPPQYVALAFDGSQTLSMWQATRDFAARLNAKDAPLAFTYFISGVYFVTDKTRALYQAPRRAKGSSDIGFGKDLADVQLRVNQVQAALNEGHEIGSHANGHFDGSKWTAQDWALEFAQFTALLFGVFTNNTLTPGPQDTSAWSITEKNITGFRAPLLGVSAGLWETLRKDGYRYDTSRVSTPSYWPEKVLSSNGKYFWNFPLAALKIAGTGKQTLSMDYNFYVSQSGAKPDPANSALYEQQMLETYMRYFQANYNGNRAPVHIGHHFSTWNNGAYWRAMQRFASTVCGLPEVKCATYNELADFMDAVSPQALAEYKKANFIKPLPLKLSYSLDAPYEAGLKIYQLSGQNSDQVAAQLVGADAKRLRDKGAKLEWQLDGEKIAAGFSVNLSKLELEGESRLSAVVKLGSEEILRSTRLIDEDHILSAEDFEARGLQGDLPEAHTDEGAH